MYICVYICAYIWQIVIRTPPRYERNTPRDAEHLRKGRNTGKAYKQNLRLLGDLNAKNEKKLKKSLETTKKAVTLQKKQQNNNFMRNWYIKYSDAKKAEKITYREYCDLYKMAKYYNSIISDYFHPHGKTLVVSFPKHFV